jgi:N12 class adenine-specific DNA methylase
MSNPFDQFDGANASASNPFDQFDAPSANKKQNKGIAGDLVTDLKRGVEQLPSIVTGLADIPVAAITGKPLVGQAADTMGGITGFAPSKWAKEAEAEYSPGRVEAKRNVDQAWEDNKTPFADAAGGDFRGIGQIAKSYIQNPQQLVGSVVESLPSMVAGGAISKGLIATKTLGTGAGIMAGEGSIMAGQQMDKLSQTEADPRTAAAASAVTGIVGGGLGLVGGKVASKLGVIDPDVALATGTMRGVTDQAKDQTVKGMVKEGAKRVAGGAVSEGAFEELPQSVLEQVLSNLAQSKPWDEGVSRAAVEGTLAGALMGGAFNVIPPKQEKKADAPPAADTPEEKPMLALPAPTYTGTPGDQIVAADAERQAAIDKAQAESNAIWAARDEYERQQAEYRKRPMPTITNDPEPIQQRIDALMGINEARLQGFARTNYEKALENAFAEQIGFVSGKDSREIPFTMGDYLKSQVAAADIDRKVAARQPAPAGITAAPVIPVVGTLSAAANIAVQSGAHAAHVAQQQAAIQNSQAEASSTKPGKADTPTTGNREAAPQAGILAGIAAQAPSIAQSAPNTQPQGQGGMPATAQQGAPVATSPAGVEFDVSKRTNQQLEHLSQHGQPGWKEAAVAEIAKRGAAAPTANSASVPALKASDSGNAPLHTTVNEETGMEASVFHGQNGKFNVVQKDRDSGESVPSVKIFDTVEAATEYAKTIVPAPAKMVEDTAKPAVEDTIGWTRMTTVEREGLLIRAGYGGTGARRLNLGGVGALNRAWEKMGQGIRDKLTAAHEARFNQNAIKNAAPAAATVSEESTTANQGPIKNQSGDAAEMVDAELPPNFDPGVQYAKRQDGSLKMKSEYTPEEWSAYTKSVIDKKLSQPKTNTAPEAKQEAAPASDADARFAKNTIFTADKVAAAKARMKAKLGTMNSGIDPELLIDGMTVAGAYIESGVRKFGDYAKAMIADLGDGVKPYLLSFYEAARAYPGLNRMGMDSVESAASQHQALLTPAVLEQAKAVVGESPKVDKKKPANLGEAVRLKADWGVQSIDGYTRSKTGANQETDYGLKGGIKDEFLADAKRYLKAVSKLLEDQGFTVHLDSKGKGQAAVSANEAGPAVSGDVSLVMRRGNFGVYATVGVSALRGVTPAHPQGVALMARTTNDADKNKYGEINSWLPLDFSAGDLADWFGKRYQASQQRAAAVDIPAASATLETGKATAPAPSIGEDNGKAIGQQGNPALEGMAAEPVRGTSGSEPVDNGSGSSRQGRGAGNEGTDGRRDAPGRSGGNRPAEVDSAAARDSGRAGSRAGNDDGRNAGRKAGSLGEDQGEARKGGYVQDGLTTATIPESNFEITDEVALGSGGQMTKYRDNVAAIRVLKTIEAERRRATAAEKKALARYVGWGGIQNAFRNGVTGQVANDWEKEVAELESLLTPKELRAASASTRNAHYTAKEVVDFMWGVVKKMGFGGGMVLEPSVGTGNFVGLMPKELTGDSFVTGIELDSLTARIAGALYPKSTIVNTGFQKAALPSNRFKLAIGNPPFGAESLRFQYKPELNGASIHNQFFLGSLDALEPGGIMAMVVSRYLMDAKDATTREKLAIDAELAGAIRLPGSAFKGNALTEVVTDVLFFRKRDIGEAEKLREAFYKRGKAFKSTDYKEIAAHQAAQQELETALRWTKTTEVADPLGGEPMVVSQYFADRPGTVIGKMERSGSMRQGGDIDVKLEKGEKLTDRLNALLEKLQQQPVQTQNEEARANTEKFHRAMGESLRLSAKGAEADAIYFDDDGDLATVVERVGALGDETALTTIKISPATPWSASLSMDLDGHWFREVAKTDKDGKPVKAVDKNGKVLKRNVYEREVFKRESDIPKTMLLGENKFAKMKALISLRDLLVKQIDLEVSRASVEQMENNRGELREAYEAFVREHGYISDAKNAAIVSDMPDEGLLMSLETGYRPEVTEKKAKATGMAPSKASAKPAAILSRPVAIPPAVIDHAETAVDALAIVLSESGAIDIKRIAELRGIGEEAAIAELTEGDKPLAFKDPENGDSLIEKNAYLSGNVRRKLEAARQAGLDANIKALEAVQPEPWSSDKVTARMGANWVPPETYSAFVTHLLGDKGAVQYAKLTNTFMVTADSGTANATSKWGTKRVPAPRLIENILNSSRIAVYDTDTDGNRNFNQTETDAANDKAKEIREEFDNWVFKDADRRAALTKLFNDIFNTRVTPQYDGSHLKFPGKVPDEIISLRRGQRNAVWRGIIDDAVLYDHAVGAGKTFTGIARVMERRRMGMSKKPAIIVPNHMVGEWAAQAYRLYPGAKILAATKKDLETKNRRRLFAKIASGDWDMVIVPHSSFQFISISPETEERILLEELAIANAALKEAEETAEPGSRFKPLSVKEAEALIEKIEKRLETARGKLGKDRLLTFEQMGIDDLSIDESHEFKNLFYSSNLTDVRGMGNKQGSNKAFDLYSKARVVRDAGGSLAFMTGTPISNSAVELYNILRYLAPNTLQESGLEHFDAFRSLYVDATAKFEPTDSGGGLKLVTRLGRSWSNMRSLMELYYSIADVVTNDDIKRWFAEDNPGKEFPLPKVKGGDRQAVSVKATPTQMRLLEETIAAFDGLDAIEDVKERNAERLRLMDRARKLSLHAKAVDPRLEDEPGGKLDMVADNAAEIWRKWTGDKGTQLIFLDRGVPKAKGDSKIIKEYDDLTAKLREASLKNDDKAAGDIIDKLEKFDVNEINELRMAQDSNWSGYQHIKNRLISLGVPANEIAFVQDFDGDAAKEQLFQAVRDGSIRILLGSSPRMGAGTNVQERLVALHHVDATWKPSDIEQREGRIIRQGNALLEKYGKDFEVEILAYVTERTVDAKLWDLNSTKLRMINAIRYYDGAFEMDFDDEAAVGMAEIAAIASGDPLLLERFKLSTEIDNLYRQKRSHRRRVESAEDSLRSAKRLVENAPKEIEEAREDAKLRAAFTEATNADVDSRRITMNGKQYGHALLTQARMDLENFAGSVGEDEKFSITIDGKEYTSKGGAEEAIQLALGDAEPFAASIGGKKIIRRSDYARALRERIGEQLADDSAVASFDAGSIGGVPVRAEVSKSWSGPTLYLGIEGQYDSTGRRKSIVGYRHLTPEKHKDGEPIPVTVNGLRPAIADFERSVYVLRDNSEDIAHRAKRAESDIASLEEQVKEPFKGAAELDEKMARLSTVEAELSGRNAKAEEQVDEEGAGNITGKTDSLSPADTAFYGMATEGKSAAEILKFIVSASRNPLNRQIAKLLLKTGIAPRMTVGTSDGWKFNAGNDKKYAAAYNPKANTVALFRPASAERHVLHELMHAATLKALNQKGLAAIQMKALFAHVKKTGELKGMYGMSDVDEFVAEAFTNPKFQAALKKVSAPATSNLKSGWHWFVRIVRNILGMSQGQENALSQAIEIGLGVMRENMALNDNARPRQEALMEMPAVSVRFRIDGDFETVKARARADYGMLQKASQESGQGAVTTDGKTVKFSSSGFKKASQHGADRRVLAVIANAKKLIESAMPLYSAEPGKAEQGVRRYHYYGVKANFGLGGDALVLLSIKESTNGEWFYDADATGVEIARAVYSAALAGRTKTGAGDTESTAPKGRLASWLAGVNQGERVRYNVADEGWSVAEPSKMDDVIYALQDKQIDMKRVVQSIANAGKKIIDQFNPYLQEELFHGRAAKGVKDFLDFELRPLLKQMQEAKVDMGDFEEYLWNRHAEERNKQIAKINPDMPDGGSGIETAKARAYLAGLSAEQRKTFEALAAKVGAMNRESQRVLIESGLEKQSTIDAWNNAYQHYVPLQREDVDSGHVGTGKGFSVRGSSTKRAMGSGRQVVDIIANLTMQRERNIVRAEKNRVSNALLGLAVQNPNPEFWKVDQAPKERVVEETAIYTVRDEAGKKLEEFTRMDEADRFARQHPGSDIDQTWGDRVKERVTPGFTSRDNVLLTRINGEDHYVIFNERDERAMRMAAAMKNLDVDNLGRVLSLVGKATRWLASINTQYNPVFGVINLIRDAQGALINLSSTPLAGEQKRVLGYTKDALVGIYKDIRAHRAGGKPSSNWAALFEEFQKEGGQTGYRDQYANAEARAEAIKSELEQFKEGKAKQFTRGLFGWLSDYNETMENAVRLAAYKAAKEKGMSNQQAASLAKNITVNFNRKGQMATQVGALYAFFNASVQGTARIAETLFEQHGGDIKNIRLSKKGKQIVLGGIMLGSMQALLLAAAGFDDDEPPEFIRERNLILPDFVFGSGKYLTLAMPLGLHVIPGIGRIATEFVLSGGKDPLKRIAAFGSMFADAFNPVGSAGWSLQTITPSVVDPFAALAENKDFTGKEIYREDFNKLNPTPGHARAKDTSTIWSKAISEALNFMTGGSEYRPGMFSPSPDQIDYLIGQATGGVGREISKAFQSGRALESGEDLPLYKVPLVGRFVGDTEGRSGKSQKFYDAIRQINMHEAEYKGLIKDGKTAEAKAYMQENPAVKMILAGNHVEQMVRKLRNQKRALLEGDAPSAEVSAIEDRIARAMTTFNERYAMMR